MLSRLFRRLFVDGLVTHDRTGQRALFRNFDGLADAAWPLPFRNPSGSADYSTSRMLLAGVSAPFGSGFWATTASVVIVRQTTEPALPGSITSAEHLGYQAGKPYRGEVRAVLLLQVCAIPLLQNGQGCGHVTFRLIETFIVPR